MKIIIRNEADKQAFLNLVVDRKIIDGKRYVGIFQEIRKKHTFDQRALLHIWFRCMAVELEGDPAAAEWYKEYYKKRALPGIAEPEIKIIKGVKLEKYSTKTLNTLQMSQLTTFVKRDAFDQFGIRLLTLEDIHFMEFYEIYR